jgi:hypothetical protein
VFNYSVVRRLLPARDCIYKKGDGEVFKDIYFDPYSNRYKPTLRGPISHRALADSPHEIFIGFTQVNLRHIHPTYYIN